VRGCGEFRKSAGNEEEIMSYCVRTAQEGGRRIAEILGTEVMALEQQCYMINIRLAIESAISDVPSLAVQEQVSTVNMFVGFGKMMIPDYATSVPTIFHNGH
jgi:hypothetical protein